MRKTSTVWWPSALLVPVLLIGVAACGGDDDDDGAEGIASLSDDAESTETTDNGATRDGEDGDADPQQAALAFAECMREHGIDMPDPQFDESGRVTQRIDADSGVDPGDPDFEAAQEACADELPGRPGQGLVPTGGGTDGDA
jgi:hypothetical protein